MSRSALNFGRTLSCLVVLLLAAMWISLVLGSTRVSGSEFVAALFGRGEDANSTVERQKWHNRRTVGLYNGLAAKSNSVGHLECPAPGLASIIGDKKTKIIRNACITI